MLKLNGKHEKLKLNGKDEKQKKNKKDERVSAFKMHSSDQGNF